VKTQVKVGEVMTELKVKVLVEAKA
jgi:hypothetical protein